jgi:hypothetical protein
LLVLIDESGCPGFKLTKGSTAYFVIVMVTFSDFSEAEKASMAIAELRESLNVYPEFKFNKTRAILKDAFFDNLCQFDFKVRALVVKKDIVYSDYLRKKTESFYNYFVQMLLRHDDSVLNNASIKIDGSGDKEFKKALGVYLRREVGSNKIKKFKFTDSRKDNLIQLADMVVGAVARSYNINRDNETRWLDMLKQAKKIENIWDFK